MIILDVREKEEFEAEHIPESILCPLSQFDLQAPGILKNLKTEEEIIVMCRTGNRSKMAINELQKHNISHLRFTTYEGGIQKWKNEGKPLKGRGGSVFPLMRQVQIIASSMIFLAFIAATFVSPEFIYLALFVGFGLALAGYTGFCPVVFLLQKMPWNNKRSGISSGTKNDCCS